jgi:hypothetical protein
MAGSHLDPRTSTHHPSINRAKPSRKTGRFGAVDLGGPQVGRAEFGVRDRVDPDLPVPTPEMPRKGVRVARRRRLLHVAGAQEGLFTVAQAAEAGLDRRARHHHLSYGNWRRTDAPDVFRLAGWPHDPHERVRAWLLWAGPGAVLTSWTALGLSGLTAAGPRVPVDLEVPFGHDRVGQRRRQRLQRQLSAIGGTSPVHLHRAVPGSAHVIAGLTVRPPAQAICAAVNHQRSSIALGLASALIDRGDVSAFDLLSASQEIGCGPITELLYRRLTG